MGLLFDLSGRFNYQHVSPYNPKGLHEQTIGQLGGFLFFQATPVEVTTPETGGGGGSISRRKEKDDEIITLFGMLIQSGILDE